MKDYSADSTALLRPLFRQTVFTSPIVALTFGELSLVAPLSNLLMEFPADIMLLCGFLTSIFYYIPVINFLAMPFGLGAGIAANYLMECAAWLASLPMASIPVTQEVLLISLIVFAAASVVIVMIRWEGFRLRLTACTTAFLLVFTALAQARNRKLYEDAGVLNTGNGSSVVLIRIGRPQVLPAREA
ncbi:MAG: ComEC/Rec2 family competence protein [Oscillospiraceae bacterium]